MQVSTIIPFYNGNDTIARAIDSVIDNPVCLEVIVMVDASPEKLILTESQCQHLAQGKLRVIESNTNLGQAAMRNMGASVSLAPLISFMDQDDMYLPAFCEDTRAALLENPDFAAVECGAQIVKDGVQLLDVTDPRYIAIMYSVPWNIMIWRNAFWQSGAFPTDPEFRKPLAGEDIAFKTAVRYYFKMGQDFANQNIRHHVRDGSATDNYIKRTRVVNGKAEFVVHFENENSGEWHAALQKHWGMVERDIQKHRALALQH